MQHEEPEPDGLLADPERPMVPAAEHEQLQRRLSASDGAEREWHNLATKGVTAAGRLVAERNLAVWLHAETKWWLDQYKHDVTVWKRQVERTEAERDLFAGELERVQGVADLATSRIDAIPNILQQHYLAWIECDHDKQMDNPQCACSKVNLGWHPTVGDAVNAWIEHVRAVLQGDQPTEEAL